MRLPLYIFFLIIFPMCNLAAVVDTSDINRMNDYAYSIRHTQIDSCKILADSALALSKKQNYEPGQALAHKTIGVYYWIKGSYHRANESYYKSLKIYEKLDDKNGIVRVTNNIALIYLAQDNFPKAEELFKKAIEMARNDSNYFMLARAELNLALTYTFMKKYKKAKKWMFEALASFTQFESQTGIADAHVYLGKVYLELDQYDSCKYHLNISLKKYDSLENYRGQVMALLYMSQCYDKLNEPRKAIEYARKTYDLATKNEYRYDVYESSDILAKNYERLGDFRKAYRYAIIMKENADSLRNEDHAKKITRLEMEYNFEKKLTEIEHEQNKQKLITEAQIDRQQLLIVLISIILLMVIVVAYLMYRNSKRKTLLNNMLQERNIEISTQKEELLSLNKQKTELIATKDKFFSIIAHDLKNPLGAFRDVMNYMISQGNELPEEERHEFMEIMKNSADNLFELLNNLLTWARSQQGHVSYEPTEIDLSLLVDNNLSLLNANAAKKEITLLSEVKENTFLTVDPNMITTVLRNLISNAIKFTPKGGEIKIACDNNPDEVVVHIIDTGIGMDEEIANNLFDLDKSISYRGTENESGTGLGLIICREFVERHNGTIAVKSKKEEGSDFYFTLPK
jgi:signal transduction histidine kinase